MILPNLAFDALLFGLLLLAALIDSAFPFSHGVASLLLVGGATFWSAQELSDWILRRVGWTQEPLLTSLALCTGGFLYFGLRNQSDFALLCLSIGLMMGALMIAISIIAAFGGSLREGRPTPVLGWVTGALMSVFLGVTAGVLALVLGTQGMESIPLKIGAVAGAFALWKLREKFSPPEINPHFGDRNAASKSDIAPTPLHAPRVAVFPQRGTLLDRLVPLFILGALLLIGAKNQITISPINSTAVASTASPSTNTPSANSSLPR